MEYLPVADEHRTSTKSSISQARSNKLSVSNGIGQFIPIVFDHLDYIDCEKIVSHKAMLSDSDELSFEYPVKECTYFTDKYIYMDEKGTELRELPEWFGAGFYRAAVNRNDFINAEDEAFGIRNIETVQSGLHYTIANDDLV